MPDVSISVGVQMHAVAPLKISLIATTRLLPAVLLLSMPDVSISVGVQMHAVAPLKGFYRLTIYVYIMWHYSTAVL